jgi:hypothetical protein
VLRTRFERNVAKRLADLAKVFVESEKLFSVDHMHH